MKRYFCLWIVLFVAVSYASEPINSNAYKKLNDAFAPYISQSKGAMAKLDAIFESEDNVKEAQREWQEVCEKIIEQLRRSERAARAIAKKDFGPTQLPNRSYMS